MGHLGNNETDAPWCGDHRGTRTLHTGTSVGDIVLAYVRGRATCGACLDAHPQGREVLALLARGAELEAHLQERVDAVARRSMVPTPETVSLEWVWAAAYAAHYSTHGSCVHDCVAVADEAVADLLAACPRGGR